MISLQKLKILTPLPKNVGDLGKFIVAKGFEKFPKVQEIAQSGHTWPYLHEPSNDRMLKQILSEGFNPSEPIP